MIAPDSSRSLAGRLKFQLGNADTIYEIYLIQYLYTPKLELGSEVKQ
jgi:hypothetical protein